MPDRIFKAADRFALRQGLNRSALFTRAVEEFLARHRRDGVTEQLNAVYANQESSLDSVLSHLQSASLPMEKW